MKSTFPILFLLFIIKVPFAQIKLEKGRVLPVIPAIVTITGTVDTSYKKGVVHPTEGRVTLGAFLQYGYPDSVKIIRKFSFKGEQYNENNRLFSAEEYFSKFDVDLIENKPLKYFEEREVAKIPINAKASTAFSLRFEKTGFARPSRICAVVTGGTGNVTRNVLAIEYYEITLTVNYTGGTICTPLLQQCVQRFYLGEFERQKEIGLVIPMIFCEPIGG